MTISEVRQTQGATSQSKVMYQPPKNQKTPQVIDFKTEDSKDTDEPIKGFSLERTAKEEPAKTKAHEVKKGDNLWKIAKQQLIDTGIKPTNDAIIDQMRKISDANDLDLSDDCKKYKTIHPGDKLKLPPVGNEEITPEENPEPAKSDDKQTPPKTDEQKPTKPGKLVQIGIDPIPQKPDDNLTPQERNEARHYGSNVADYLVGYTDDSEQGLTKEVITQHVNSRNVLDFLSGYERNRGLGDHFFTQLSSEYGFDEKQNLMKDVASKLSRYLKNNGQPHLAREIDVALQDNGFTKKEIAKLDQIVRTMLTNVPGLKR